MKPNLTIIDTTSGILDLIFHLRDKEYVAFDTETTGLDKGSTIIGFSICAEANEAFYVILHKWIPELSMLTPTTIDKEAVLDLLDSLRGKSLLMHNGVFDCAMVEDNFKISLVESLHTDTMIAAHLTNENRRVGLKELAKEYFGEDSTQEQEEMKKSVIASGGEWSAKNKEMYKAEPIILGTYGAKDALLTFKLFWILLEELVKEGLEDFFYVDESMPLLRGPTYQLNTMGLKVDQQAMTTLKKTLEAECMEAKDFIYAEIGKYIEEKYPGTNKKNKFNISASQQLSWLLFGKLELEFGNLTDAGKDICKTLGLRLPYTQSAKREFIALCQRATGNISSPEAVVNGKKVNAKKVKEPWAYIKCDKKILSKLAPKYKWIQRLLEYQRKTKILTTYIKGIEQRTQYGIIRPSFLQHGTTSGRYSSRNPNFQNLPRDDKRIKACIVPRPGKCFVGADYSQLEPRVFAYCSKDERLLNSFKNKEDFYSVVGIEVYGKFDCTPFKEGANSFGEKHPKLRQDAKTFTLASTYGATGFQLSPMMGKPSDAAQEDINNYFEAFPSVRQMMLDSHNMAKTKGYVDNIFGRKRRMPDAMKINRMYGKVDHSDLPYEARNILNLAVNHQIQSTGASIINRAMIAFCNAVKEAGIDAKLVVQVHDSLVVECNESDANDVYTLLQHCMENTVHFETIELEAKPQIGKTLAEV